MRHLLDFRLSPGKTFDSVSLASATTAQAY